MTASTRIDARALGALALGFSILTIGPAKAQDGFLTYQNILAVLPGAWELAPSETDEADRGALRCDQEPTVIRIVPDDDGLLRYESQNGYAEDAQVNRSTIRAIPDAILLQYEDEERVTPDGDLVQWLLFMPDRDHFYWMRTDWIETGGRTAMHRRCAELPVA